jgi:hypothetical protein
MLHPDFRGERQTLEVHFPVIRCSSSEPEGFGRTLRLRSGEIELDALTGVTRRAAQFIDLLPGDPINAAFESAADLGLPEIDRALGGIRRGQRWTPFS